MSDFAAPTINRDRLSVLVATVLLLSILFRFMQFPEASWDLNVLGSPLQISLTGDVLLVLLTVALVVAGTRYVLYAHPDVPHRIPRPAYISWVLPGLLVGLATYAVNMAPSLPLWSVGVLSMGLLVSLAVSAEFIALSTDDPRYTRARLALNLLAYLLVFALFYLIYQLRVRSLITATITMLVSFVVALDLLSVADVTVERVALFAGVVGLVVGESTWALNYWRLDNLVGAFLILLVFYVSSGIAHQYLLERLSKRVIAEFLMITIAALFILLFFS